MSARDGGAAFPGLHPSADCRYIDAGMTLRDYFAAKAMQAGVNNADLSGLADDELSPEIADCLADLGRGAYRIADAMLKAREVQP